MQVHATMCVWPQKAELKVTREIELQGHMQHVATLA